MSFFLYIVLFILIFRFISRYTSSPKIKKNKNNEEIKYQDAEFREID